MEWLTNPEIWVAFFTLKWAVLVCMCILVAALLMGIFPLFSTL